mgnify:CR=1 FL=1
MFGFGFIVDKDVQSWAEVAQQVEILVNWL